MILIALGVPLLISLLLTRGDTRRFVGFLTLGLLCAVLAVNINAYLFVASGMDTQEVTIKLTPIAEEGLKAIPVLFYVAWTHPKRSGFVAVSLACGLGFAIYENCYFLMVNTAPDLIFVLVRGFAAGVMHAVCALLLGYGLTSLGERYRYMIIPGSVGLYCVVTVVHATYNLLISAPGAWSYAGYLLPMALALALFIWVRHSPQNASHDQG